MDVYINLNNTSVETAPALPQSTPADTCDSQDSRNSRDTPATAVAGVGGKKTAYLKNLGITSLLDIVTYYPKSFTDYSRPVSLRETETGATAAIAAVVVKKMRPHITSGYSLYRLIARDKNDEEFVIVFWRTPYWYQILDINTEYIFYGKIGGDALRKEMSQPSFVKAADTSKMLPRYRLTAGLSNAVMTTIVKNALLLYRNLYGKDTGGDTNNPQNNEDLLRGTAERYALADNLTAISDAHFPPDEQSYTAARRRIAFEEMLTLQLGLGMLKQTTASETGTAMSPEYRHTAEEFLRSLPFTPTEAQIRSVNECLDDLIRDTPMNRLLQGDVGSGKTAVAAAACVFVAANGYQSCLMAPTEILAKQHYSTFCEFLGDKYDIALLTGSLTPKEKADVKKRIKNGDADIVIGTHALVQKSVVFSRLAFIIVDEQHRFGVKQRETLAGKGRICPEGKEITPHILIMSATPIPRTLALFMYADLAVSVLDEMPQGRKPVSTYSVDDSFLPRLHKFIRKQAEKKLKSYVVCPLIEDSDVTDETDSNTATLPQKQPPAATKASAMRIKAELAQALDGLNVGLLHGKMKQTEKDTVMRDFKYGDTDVLVSTTVIEVGVDVPDAVIMLILNAEQFGLSALHQLRGRVGRGSEQSYCILVTNNKSEYTAARMRIMTETTDGFKIAGEDLRLRGPGDFFGNEQHGLPKMKFTSMPRLDGGNGDNGNDDLIIIEQTKGLADEILRNDASLAKPENACYLELLKRSNVFGGALAL